MFKNNKLFFTALLSVSMSFAPPKKEIDRLHSTKNLFQQASFCRPTQATKPSESSAASSCFIGTHGLSASTISANEDVHLTLQELTPNCATKRELADSYEILFGEKASDAAADLSDMRETAQPVTEDLPDLVTTNDWDCTSELEPAYQVFAGQTSEPATAAAAVVAAPQGKPYVDHTPVQLGKGLVKVGTGYINFSSFDHINQLLDVGLIELSDTSNGLLDEYKKIGLMTFFINIVREVNKKQKFNDLAKALEEAYKVDSNIINGAKKSVELFEIAFHSDSKMLGDLAKITRKIEEAEQKLRRLGLLKEKKVELKKN